MPTRASHSKSYGLLSCSSPSPSRTHYEGAAASQAWYTVNDTPNGFLLNPPLYLGFTP